MVENRRYVVVPTSSITNDMREVSQIEVNSNHGKTVFNYHGDKPSCFSSYTGLTRDEWYDIWLNTEKDNWGHEDIVI